MPPAIIWVAKPTGFLLPFRDINQLGTFGKVLREARVVGVAEIQGAEKRT